MINFVAILYTLKINEWLMTKMKKHDKMIILDYILGRNVGFYAYL